MKTDYAVHQIHSRYYSSFLYSALLFNFELVCEVMGFIMAFLYIYVILHFVLVYLLTCPLSLISLSCLILYLLPSSLLCAFMSHVWVHFLWRFSLVFFSPPYSFPSLALRVSVGFFRNLSLGVSWPWSCTTCISSFLGLAVKTLVSKLTKTVSQYPFFFSTYWVWSCLLSVFFFLKKRQDLPM